MFDSLTVSFVAYTLGIITIGLYSARFAKRTVADFFLADQGLGTWVAALSASASAESGWVTLGLVGMAYKTGIGAVWIVVGTMVAFLFNWLVLAWRLRARAAQYEALTIPDLLASRYDGPSALCIRWVGVLIILTMLTAYVAAQLNAAGKTFSGTFGWNHTLGVLVGAGIVLVYTITGGFRAIAWTDVVQGTVMVLTMIGLPGLLIWKIGGPGVLWQRLAEDAGNPALTDPFAGKTGLALVGFLVLWLGIPLGNPGQPHVLVRLMAIKDRKAVVRCSVISSCWVLFLFSGAVAMGMAARVYFGQLEDPEKTLPMIAQDPDIVPGFIGGLILAAVLAAICSTADSQLLVSASAVSHDLVSRIFRCEMNLRTRKILDRSAVLLVGMIATAIAASDVKSVFTFVLDYGWAGLGAGFGPAIIISLYWRRATGWGVLAGMVVGVSTAVFWKQFPELQQQVYNLVPAFFFSAGTICIVSLFTSKRVESQNHM